MSNPEMSFVRGNCRSSIFYNQVKRNGEIVEIPKVVITRSYLDKNNEWKATNSFNLNDIPKLIIVATKAYDYLTSRKQNNEIAQVQHN